MAEEHYTFGDTDEATARLRRLAELFEPDTRDLLRRSRVRSPRLAVDLGCGPGWSTRLIREVLDPRQIVGLDASERHVAEAKRIHDAGMEFRIHDVTRTPFPIREPDALFCRFLLTHLRSPQVVLKTWAEVASPNAMLFIHETETLESDHPALHRYYELVGELQKHYGQELRVGPLLAASVETSGWQVIESERRVSPKPASKMADLHLSNLRTWRNDEYAKQAFDPREIDSLESALKQITEDSEGNGVVVYAARQIIARRLA